MVDSGPSITTTMHNEDLAVILIERQYILRLDILYTIENQIIIDKCSKAQSTLWIFTSA